MSYKLNWTNPVLNPNKPDEKVAIVVPVAATINNAASITLTGKGAPNYGMALQESLMHMLENFANGTAPLYPTVGQLWYNSTTDQLMVCTETSPEPKWKMVGIHKDTVFPYIWGGKSSDEGARLGDLFILLTGEVTCKLFIYTGVGRFPETLTDGVPTGIGGWEQIYPTVEYVGGREEYDAVYDIVQRLIGPTSKGGSTAASRLVKNLTDFSKLDASLLAAYTTLGPDNNLISPMGSETTADLLKVDPTSSDWDALLTAAKFAIKRLDIPVNSVDNISDIPFVRDGTQYVIPDYVKSVLTNSVNKSTNDYLLPSLDRRSNRKLGSITMHRKYTETFNTLYNAYEQRYSIQGVAGESGSVHSYWDASRAGTVVETVHLNFSFPLNGAVPPAVTFNVSFASAEDLASWANSGGILDATVVLGGNAFDTPSTDLKFLLASLGTIRITADKVRNMTNAASRKSVGAISTVGFHNLTDIGVPINMCTETLRSASYTVVGTKTSPTSMTFTITLKPQSAVTGTLSFTVSSVADTMTDPITGRVYGQPASVTRV